MEAGFAWGGTAPPPIDPCDPGCGGTGTSCVLNSDCPHSDPCLIGVCSSGQCSHVPYCFDGLACTVDTCVNNNGTPDCTYTPDDTLCDDADVCTDDQCVGSNGVGCVFTNNTAPCDDNDNNVCTDGLCVGGVCVPTNNTAPCEVVDENGDPLVCVVNDVCVDGICVGVPPMCDDGRFCTAGDFCDPILFCEPGQGTPCSGSTPVCDEFNDRCVECLGQSDCAGNEVEDQCDTALGVCVECLTVEQCDDDIACTSEACHNGTCTPNFDICAGQDGLFCNGVETCDMVIGAGTCLPGTDPCPGQNCNETTDTCEGCLVDADCPVVECTVGTCCIDPNGCCIDPADPTTCGAVNECIYDVDPDGDGVLNCQDQCCNDVGCPTNSVRPGCPCDPGDGCCDAADPDQLCCDANDPNSWCPCNP